MISSGRFLGVGEECIRFSYLEFVLGWHLTASFYYWKEVSLMSSWNADAGQVHYPSTAALCNRRSRGWSRSLWEQTAGSCWSSFGWIVSHGIRCSEYVFDFLHWLWSGCFYCWLVKGIYAGAGCEGHILILSICYACWFRSSSGSLPRMCEATCRRYELEHRLYVPLLC